MQLDLLQPNEPLTRDQAIARLLPLLGHDLQPYAEPLGVTVLKNGRRNKGWAGQVVECLLGQKPNSKHAPDFEDFELKVIPLTRRNTPERWWPRETMSLSMFTESSLELESFQESALFAKLRRMLIVGRSFEDLNDAHSHLICIVPFDLNAELEAELEADYEECRFVVRESGAYALTGELGRLIQPRPKGGKGHPGRHAFYARIHFVAQILGLSPCTRASRVQHSAPQEIQ